jgi:hypothetical protein
VNISPRESLTGRKMDYNSVLRASFGAYAQVTVRATDNSMSARTVGGLVLYLSEMKQVRTSFGI